MHLVLILNSKEIDNAMEEFEKNPPTVSEWIDAGIGLGACM